MCPASEKMNLSSGLRETATEVSPYATRSENGDLHHVVRQL